MKSYKYRLLDLLYLGILMGLAAGALVYLTADDRIVWPDFTESKKIDSTEEKESLAPQVVTKSDRDYGYRLGDRIPVELFLKQLPGTRIDLHSLALEGDFELIDQPKINTRDLKDGSRLIRIRFEIQSFALKDKLLLKTSMVFRVLNNPATGDEDHADRLISIPAFEPYTSKTWDGRELIQDGSPDYDHSRHLAITALLVFAGLGGAFCFWQVGKKLQKIRLEEEERAWSSRRAQARTNFDVVWARFEQGEYCDENYKELALIIRRLFLIESHIRREIQAELGRSHPYRKHVLTMLDIIGKVLYRSTPLTEAEHFRIKEIFDKVVPPHTPVHGDNEARTTD